MICLKKTTLVFFIFIITLLSVHGLSEYSIDKNDLNPLPQATDVTISVDQKGRNTSLGLVQNAIYCDNLKASFVELRLDGCTKSPCEMQAGKHEHAGQLSFIPQKSYDELGGKATTFPTPPALSLPTDIVEITVFEIKNIPKSTVAAMQENQGNARFTVDVSDKLKGTKCTFRVRLYDASNDKDIVACGQFDTIGV